VKILSALSGILFCLAFVPYALAILGRDIRFHAIKPAKPEKASWIIWASLDTIIVAGMFAKDAINVR